MNARQFTFSLLLKQKKTHAYSNLLLENALKTCDFNSIDKAFATALFYGVIQKKICIDYQLNSVLHQPIKKLRDEVYIALQMGVYQLFFMDKVPASAAINESVKLVKKNKCAYASGLVNAALRNIARQGYRLPDVDAAEYLSVKYSVPQHLIDLWHRDYDEQTVIGILESFSQPPSTVIRVNTLLTDSDALLLKLKEEGVIAKKSDTLENAIVLEKTGDIASLPSFRAGLFHVEDTAAQTAALLLEAKAGERVLDTCSAPGGKAFTLAEQMRRGEIYACDIYENRVGLIRSGAERLHIDFIKTFVQDATQFNPSFGLFDKVLCDVPCSGLGIIRKKPEIMYKTAQEIAAASALQYDILCTSFRYLKPGGTLVYATCTLRKAENEAVVQNFLKTNKATLVHMKTYFPHTDKTDGFFTAVIKKDE